MSSCTSVHRVGGWVSFIHSIAAGCTVLFSGELILDLGLLVRLAHLGAVKVKIDGPEQEESSADARGQPIDLKHGPLEVVHEVAREELGGARHDSRDDHFKRKHTASKRCRRRLL